MKARQVCRWKPFSDSFVTEYNKFFFLGPCHVIVYILAIPQNMSGADSTTANAEGGDGHEAGSPALNDMWLHVVT